MVERQRAPLRDLKLEPHEVDPGDAFGHRMLDLDARVHLQKIEASVISEKKFDGSGADIADRARRLHGGRAHPRPQLERDGGRRRFLDQLLMSALDRAVAFAEMDDRAVLVSEDLDLDMAGAEKGALEKEPTVAEGALGFAARRTHRGVQRVGRPDDPHAPPAAAGARLHHQRIADAPRFLRETRRALVVAMIAGRAGDARRHHPRLGLAFVAHRPHCRRRRPDEDDAGRGAAFGEVCAFGEEAVARMHGLGARRLRRSDQGVDREIGLRRRRGADAHGVVGEADMQRIGVSVAIDRYGAKAFGARGANDAAGDLAAIGDEHGGEARAHALVAQDGARFSMKALSPSRPSGPRRAAAKLFAAVSI